MIISVINHADSTVSDEELHRVIRAINRQLANDFAPFWGYGAQLRLEGRSGDRPNKQSIADMRGDAVLYVWDKADTQDALGYHDRNNRGIPFGFVFTEISKQLGESWSATLSHEALELVGDAEANLLVQGPHPENPVKVVYHWYEMCDAVQAETYQIDGVELSNFILPLYFTSEAELGGRNDFLGRRSKGKTLTSFGVNPGGYIGFFDPAKNDHVTYSLKGDAKATKRLKIKSTLAGTRRSIRYRRNQSLHGRQDYARQQAALGALQG